MKKTDGPADFIGRQDSPLLKFAPGSGNRNGYAGSISTVQAYDDSTAFFCPWFLGCMYSLRANPESRSANSMMIEHQLRFLCVLCHIIILPWLDGRADRARDRKNYSQVCVAQELFAI